MAAMASPNKDKEYEYTDLKNLKADSKIYNVYGVVKFFREPRRTKGPDWNMIVVLTDQSLGWDNKVTFNLFMKDPSSFPALTRIGAVVRFHRVKAQMHNGILQGLISPGFASLVMDRKATEPKSTKINYTYTDRDKHKIKELLQWSGPFVGEELQSFAKKIEEIKANQYFDLRCQVVGEAKINDNHVVFKVWDGTKAGDDIQILKVVEDQDARVQWEDVVAPHVTSYLVDVSIFDDHVREADQILLGDYITFINLRAFVPNTFRNAPESETPKVELCLHNGKSYGRSVRVMPDDDAETLKGFLNGIVDTAYIDGTNRAEPGTSKEPGRVEAPGSVRKPVTTEPLNDIVSNTVKALSAIVMKTCEPDPIWFKRSSETPEPEDLPYLGQLLEEVTHGQVFKVVAQVQSDMRVNDSLVMHCTHCNFLSSLPDDDLATLFRHLNNESNQNVASGSGIKTRLRVPHKRITEKHLKELAKKAGKKVKKPKVQNRPKARLVLLPLTSEYCRAVSSLEKVKRFPGDWFSVTKPAIYAETGGDFYKCPHCEKQNNEPDPCVLRYRYHLELVLSDFSVSVPVTIWDHQLDIDGRVYLARDVISDKKTYADYKRWFDSVTGGKHLECVVKCHVNERNGENMHCFQIVKIGPVPET